MIYFDNAATTRALPAAAEKMSQMLCEQFGNPASVSAMGLAVEKHSAEHTNSDEHSQNCHITSLTVELQQQKTMCVCRDRQNICHAGNQAVKRAFIPGKIHTCPSFTKFYTI